MTTGIAVLFPGTGYTCREPLLLRCAGALEAGGYDVVRLDFGAIPFAEIETIPEAVEATKPVMRRQLRDIRFSEYGQVIFLSKSLGTICAAWLAAELDLPARQIMLTPVAQTLADLREDADVAAMVVGDQDRHMAYRTLQSFCRARGIPCVAVENVGHNLIDARDPDATDAIEAMAVSLCERAMRP